MISPNEPQPTPDWIPDSRPNALDELLRNRAARDNGVRHNLRDVCESLGIDYDELEDEHHVRGEN